MDSGSPQSAGDPAPSNGQAPNNSDNVDQDFGDIELFSFIRQREAAGETVSVDMIRNFIEELMAAEKIPRDDHLKKMLEQLGLCRVLRNKRWREFQREFLKQQNTKCSLRPEVVMHDFIDQAEGLKDPDQKQQLLQAARSRLVHMKAIQNEEDKALNAAIQAMLVSQFGFE